MRYASDGALCLREQELLHLTLITARRGWRDPVNFSQLRRLRNDFTDAWELVYEQHCCDVNVLYHLAALKLAKQEPAGLRNPYKPSESPSIKTVRSRGEPTGVGVS